MRFLFFIAGVGIGAPVGIIIMGLMFTASEEDKKAEQRRKEREANT